MRIVKVKGGLGNQMFQYAFAKNLEMKFDDEVRLDFSSYRSNPNDLVRKPRILNFAIEVNEAAQDEITSLTFFQIPGVLTTIKDKVKILIEIIFNKKYIFVRDSKYIEWNKLERYKYYDGYWQSWKYVDEVKEILYKEYTPKTPVINPVIKEMEKNNSVFIGVRRGDYLKEKKLYGSFENDYYLKAMEYIAQKIDNPIFYIFSNEIDWVKSNMNFGYYDVRYRDEKNMDDFEELILMSSCKHAIIVNSTFYWWGAWLIKNPKKIVIAPKDWFANGWKNEIVPPQWVKI